VLADGAIVASSNPIKKKPLREWMERQKKKEKEKELTLPPNLAQPYRQIPVIN